MFKIFSFFRYYFDIFIDMLYGWYFYKKEIVMKPPRDDIVFESAVSLANKIKNREVTCERVVKAFVDQINQVNDTLNGLVDDRFEAALQEARTLDKRIFEGDITDEEFDRKPFLGIPFTSKESTSCKGLAYTFGLKKRQHYKGEFDADYVAACKNAGGILLGVTNIPQFNLWPETYNPIYGLTKNPYNTTRTVGGSAGGEACMLAACGTPIGLGTDLGGSSRIPAMMCGVYAHKLTCHLISVKGMTYRDGSEKTSMISAGPMTKYATDLGPLIKSLVGRDAEKLQLDVDVDIRDIKVYYVINPKDVVCSPMRKDMMDILLSAVDHFTEICYVKPEELFIEELKYAIKLWSYWMSKEPNKNFMYDINNREGELSPIKEILKKLVLQSDFTFGTIMNFIHIMGQKANSEWAEEVTLKLKQNLLFKLDETSVLLYPSAPFTARPHYTNFFRPFNFGFFAIWNFMKFPATQVPMGLNEENLPLGIQVVAKPYQDRLCIAVAKELENKFGGYVSPFKKKEH